MVITLVADVARSYFSLRDLDNRLEISRQTVESRRKGFGIAKLRFEGGITSELEVKQTKVELARAEADIPRLEQDITVTENALSILLGRNPEEIERGRALTEQTILPVVPAGLPSELLKRRPDIREAEHDLIAANARVRVALAQFYPQISLTAEAGLQNDRFRGMARGDSFTWNWALAGIFRVFDWGRNQGNLEVARAVYEQALVRYEMAIQQSFREVSDAMSIIHHTRKIREREETLLAATRDYRRLALTRYLHGDVSLLETLDADRQLFDAQLSLSSTIRDQLNSMVILYRALGGGWRSEDEEEEEGEEEGRK